jgi:nitroreductase
MDFLQLVTRTRTYRRFDQSRPIPIDTLRELVNLARLAPSARNAQPLKYMLINDAENCAKIFPLLAWAGYLTDWEGPTEGERPTAYIIVLFDTAIGNNNYCDDGLAIQNILLGATEKELGGCIIGAVNKKELRAIFNIPASLEILYVLALGKPAEEVVLEPIKENDHKYWRDECGVHHVPKRSLDEIIVYPPE